MCLMSPSPELPPWEIPVRHPRPRRRQPIQLWVQRTGEPNFRER